MLTVDNAALLSSLFTTFLANVFSVTFVGWVRAHVSSYFGDDTAEQMGFMTLNPLAHVDFFFLISFMLFGIGLGQYPFITADMIVGPYRNFKFYFAYFLNTMLYLLISIVALATLLVFFGQSILELFKTITLVDVDVMRYYPDLSSHAFSLALVGIAMVYINCLLAVFSLFVNLLWLVVLPMLNHFFSDTKYKEIWVLVGAIVSIYLLLDYLRAITAGIIFGAGFALAHLFGG